MCCYCTVLGLFFCFKKNTSYVMRISDWSSDVCSSDLEIVIMQMGTVFYMGCVSAIALAFPGMALAQSAPAAAPAPQAGGQIQDILVTARRTRERKSVV